MSEVQALQLQVALIIAVKYSCNVFLGNRNLLNSYHHPLDSDKTDVNQEELKKQRAISQSNVF